MKKRKEVTLYNKKYSILKIIIDILSSIFKGIVLLIFGEEEDKESYCIFKYNCGNKGEYCKRCRTYRKL